MLTLTENARTIVSAIAAQADSAEQGGLRISSPADGAGDFTVAVAPSPEPQDEVVESAGARVFLQDEVAPILTDRVLDAEVDAQGSVHFALTRAQ